MPHATDKVAGLDARRLRDLLNYRPETGMFCWRETNSNRAKAGSIAGTRDKRKGYIYIRIDGRRYLAHRLAWLYVTGEWPEHQVDHRDLNPSNNKWSNLRAATDSDNKANRRGHGALPKGVIFDRRRSVHPYYARIMVRGVFHHIGSFETAEQAAAAYSKAARKHFGQFARSA